MNLSSVRGQVIKEDVRLRLGEVRFLPRDKRADMSRETFELLEADEDKAREYVVRRAQAMRKEHSSMITLLPVGLDPEPVVGDPLVRLEAVTAELLSALTAVTDPSVLATGAVVHRRKEARKLLADIQARMLKAQDLLDVVEELMEAKVLA